MTCSEMRLFGTTGMKTNIQKSDLPKLGPYSRGITPDNFLSDINLERSTGATRTPSVSARDQLTSVRASCPLCALSGLRLHGAYSPLGPTLLAAALVCWSRIFALWLAWSRFAALFCLIAQVGAPSPPCSTKSELLRRNFCVEAYASH